MRHDDLRKQAPAQTLPTLDLSLTPPPIEARCGRCARSFSIWSGYVSTECSVCDACLESGKGPA